LLFTGGKLWRRPAVRGINSPSAAASQAERRSPTRPDPPARSACTSAEPDWGGLGAG
jgi:hypothetical protein